MSSDLGLFYLKLAFLLFFNDLCIILDIYLWGEFSVFELAKTLDIKTLPNYHLIRMNLKYLGLLLGRKFAKIYQYLERN